MTRNVSRGLKADMAQFAAFKGVVERVLGPADYYDIRESADFPALKRVAIRVLTSLQYSIHDTVEVVDQTWREETDEILDSGIEAIRASEDAAELFSTLSASLICLSFQQVGFVPWRKTGKRLQLRKGGNSLNHYRTVQYVQTASQAERLKKAEEPRAENRALNNL